MADTDNADIQQQANPNTLQPYDLQGYANTFKNYYGNQPLSYVAQDVYKRSTPEQLQGQSFGDWLKNTGMQSQIDADNQQRAIQAAQQNDRGIIGETLKGLGRGIVSGLPEMAGSVLQRVNPFDSDMQNSIGQSLEQFGQNNATRFPSLTQSNESANDSEWNPHKFLPQIAEMAPKMALAGGVGAGVTALTGGLGAPAAVAGLTGLGAESAMWYGDQAQQTYDQAKAKGLSDDDALAAAHTTGGIMGAGMAAMHFLPPMVYKALSAPVQEGILNSIVAGRPSKQIATDILKSMAPDVVALPAQTAAITMAENHYGITDKDALAEAAKTIPMAIFMGGVFSARGAFKDEALRTKVQNALTNPDFENPKNTLEAIKYVYSQAKKINPDLAESFKTTAIDQLMNGKPIAFDDDAFYKPGGVKTQDTGQVTPEPVKPVSTQPASVDDRINQLLEVPSNAQPTSVDDRINQLLEVPSLAQPEDVLNGRSDSDDFESADTSSNPADDENYANAQDKNDSLPEPETPHAQTVDELPIGHTILRDGEYYTKIEHHKDDDSSVFGNAQTGDRMELPKGTPVEQPDSGKVSEENGENTTSKEQTQPDAITDTLKGEGISEQGLKDSQQTSQASDEQPSSPGGVFLKEGELTPEGKAQPEGVTSNALETKTVDDPKKPDADGKTPEDNPDKIQFNDRQRPEDNQKEKSDKPTAEQAQSKFVDIIDKARKSGINIHIVDKPDDIADEGKRNAALSHEEKSGRQVQGFADTTNSEIHVIAGAHENMGELAQTLAHELVGHLGLEKFMGKDLDSFLDYMGNHPEYGKQIRDIAAERGIDISTQEGQRQAAKEHFADLVQHGNINPSLWSRFVTVFKNALRRMGFKNEWLNNIGDNDIAEIIRGSREAVEGNQRIFGDRSPDLNFKDVYHGSPQKYDGMDAKWGEGTHNHVLWDQPTLDKVALLEHNGEKIQDMRISDVPQQSPFTDKTLEPEARQHIQDNLNWLDKARPEDTGDPGVMASFVNGFKGIWKTIREGSGAEYKDYGDMSKLQMILGTPLHWSAKFPVVKQIFDYIQNHISRKAEFRDQIFKSPDGSVDYLETIKKINAQHPKDAAVMGEYLRGQDILGPDSGYTIRQGKGDNKNFYLVSPSGKKIKITFKTYEQARQAMKQYEMKQFANDNPNVHPDVVSTLGMFRQMGFNQRDMYVNGINKLRDAYKSVMGKDLTEIPYMDKDGNEKFLNINDELQRIGDLQGTYFPRKRQSGDYTLTATKVGTHPILENFDIATPSKPGGSWLDHIPTSMNQRANELEAQGYDVKYGKADKLPESIFLDILGKRMSLQQFINKGWENVSEKSNGEVLKDMRINGSWDNKSGSKDYVVRGAGLAKDHAAVLQHLGGEYRYIQQKGQEGFHEIRFKNAPFDIADKVEQALISHTQSKYADAAAAMHFVTEMADMLKGRGGRSGGIQRSDATGINVWKGYEEDPVKAFAMAGMGLSGAMAKAELAKHMNDVINGTQESWQDYKKRIQDTTSTIWPSYAKYQAECNARKIDAAKQPNLYKAMTQYSQNILRNDEGTDRIIGTMKSLAVLKYLGFRLAGPALHFTNLVTSLPAVMSSNGGIDYHKTYGYIGKAISDYTKYKMGNASDVRTLDSDTVNVLEHIEKNGWGAKELDNETMGMIQGKFGKGFDKLTQYAMAPFKLTENLNRIGAILGTYHALKDMYKGYWTPEAHAEALMKAKEVSDFANGVFGKANLPYVAQGDGIAANMMRSFYTFKMFSHNYMQNMIKMGFEKDLVPLTHMLLAPAILMGAGATALNPVISGMAKALGYKDNPEEGFYKWISDEFGNTASMFARKGLIGLGGYGPSFKGHTSLDTADLPTSIADLFGAPGSVAMDLAHGARMIGKGDIEKGMEKILPSAVAAPMQAYREYSQGETTQSGKPIFYGANQVKMTGMEAIMKALSFNPTRVAAIRDELHGTELSREMMTKERSEIVERARKAVEDQDQAAYLDVMDRMNKYNDAIMANSRYQGFPTMTWKKTMQTIKQGDKPNRIERSRGES